jgi:hypothetical protein
MTLFDIATFVCTKLGKIDDDSLLACKEFIRRRHQMVYDLALWKDSICLEQVPLQLEGSNPPIYRYGAILSGEVRQPIKIRLGSAYGSAELTLGVRAINDMMQFESLLETGAPANWHEEGTSGVPVFMPDGGGPLSFEAFSVDAGKKVYISGRSTESGNKAETLTMAAGVNSTTTGDWERIYAIEKEATAEAVTMTHAGTITLMGPTDTVFRYPVIRLSPMPLGETQQYPWALVYGKRFLRQMAGDGDLLQLKNADNLLIAYATGDMLERSRQYGKAAVKFQEAQGMLEVMKDNEVHQSAHQAMISPEPVGCLTRDDFGW